MEHGSTALLSEPLLEEERPPSPTLILGESVDISSVAELRRRFLAMLEDSESAVVDCRQVERIDTAGAQLLLGFQRHSEQTGKQVAWVGNLQPVSKAAASLGLERELRQS